MFKDMLSAIVEGIGYVINNFLFTLWKGGAIAVDFIERLFRLFAGLEPTYKDDGTIDNSDIFGRMIYNPIIEQIFTNLIIAATILLMFFTIVKIIQIQYKEKEGGSPYTIVFRMFKAMVMFMFITAACVVGMQVSKVVLQALDSATKSGTRVGMGGTIFGGMAADANRALQVPEYNQFRQSTVDNRSNLLTTNTEPMWIWNDEKIVLYASNAHPAESNDNNACVLETYISPVTGIMFFNIPIDVTKSGDTLIKDVSFLHSNWQGTVKVVPYDGVHRLEGYFGYDQLWAADSDGKYRRVMFGINDRGYVYPESGYYAGDVWGIPAGEGSFDGTFTHRIRIDGDLGAVEKIDYTNEKPPTMQVTDTESGMSFTEPSGLEYVETGYKEQWVYIFGQDKYEFVSVRKTFIYCAYNKPIGSKNPLRARGTIAKQYYFITKYPTTPLRQFYISNVQGVHPDYQSTGDSSKDIIKYGLWINEVMKNKGSFVGVASDAYSETIDGVGYLKIQKSGEAGVYLMSYMNTRAVNIFYDINSFNWLIGFGGIFLAMGVFFSFMFGLIQRFAELVLLYVFSPITLAFYPFDDGAMFNNSFVKPFYKKAIAVYAPILSLNLFFPIMNVFDSINWFNPNTAATQNFLAQCFVTIAILSMLPKMRTTIQSMLGADAIEERKMSQVFKDAWKNTGKAASSGMLETAKAWTKHRLAHGKSVLPGVSEFKGLQDQIKNRKLKNRALNEKIAGERGWQRTADGKGWFNKDTGKTISGAQLMAERMSARRTDKRMVRSEKRAAKQAEKDGLDKVVDNKIAEGRKLEAEGKKDEAKNKYAEAAKIINENKAMKRKFGALMGLSGNELDKYVHGNNKVAAFQFAKEGKNKGIFSNYKTRQQEFQEKRDEEALAKAGGNEAIADAINGNKLLKRKYLDMLGFSGKDDMKETFDADMVAELRKDGKLGEDAVKATILKKAGGNRVIAETINSDEGLKRKYNLLLGGIGDPDKLKFGVSEINKLQAMGKLDDDIIDKTLSARGRKVYTYDDIDKYEKREREAAAISKNKGMIGAYLSQYYAGNDSVLKKFTDGKGNVDEKMLQRFLLDGDPGKGEPAWLDMPGNINMRREFNIEEKSPKLKPNFLSNAGHKIKQWKDQSAVMGMLFDMDNGLFAQTKLFKTIDSFGYNKILKDVEKIGDDKVKRLEDEAYGKARMQRMAGGLYKNEVERTRMAEQRVKAEDYEKQFGNFQAANDAKQKQMVFDTSQYAYKVFKSAGSNGDIILREDVLKGFDKDTINEVVTNGNWLNSSKIDKSTKSAVADRLSARFDIIANGTEDDLTKKYEDSARTIMTARDQYKDSVLLTRSKESVKEYHEVREVTRNKDAEVFKNMGDFDKEQAKRLSQMAEQDGVSQRVLGISEDLAKKLTEAQKAIFDKDNDFSKIKAAYDAGEKVVTLKDGTKLDVKVGDNKWFGAMQAAAYEPFEKAIGKVKFKGVAFRDYVEKSGEQVDGLIPTKIAAEQIKLMQDTVGKVSDATSQLFRTEQFTKCVEDGNFQKLANELRNAYEGKDHSLDKTVIAEINKKGELRELAEMFGNMYGDASGEMRGGGFASASNMIARTFRMAFIDEMTNALNATIAEFDARQRSYQMSLQKFATEGADMVNNDARLVQLMGGKVNLAGIDASNADVKEYHGTLDKMADAIKRALNDKSLSDPDRIKYDNMLREISSKKAEVTSNVYIKVEQDKMLTTTRRLENIDVIPRSTMKRAKGGKRE